MFWPDSNQILLLTCLVLVCGAGTYLTYFHQQDTIASLEQKIEAKKQDQEEIRSLRADRANAESRLRTVRRRWRTRYKVVPATISSPDIVSYLTELTETGFQQFDVTSAGSEERDGYSVHTFDATGQAYFTNLYRFVWTIENNRPFYRIRGLSLSYLEERETDEESGRTTMDVLVSFDMEVEAIYGAATDLPAPTSPDEGEGTERLPVAKMEASPPLPSSVVPNPAPEINPFYPLVFEKVPPNQYDRLNVESAQLLSIVDGKAVFQTDEGLQQVGEGDRVYLGRIEEVSPSEGRVVARLNRGGIVDRVERTLGTESPLRVRGTDAAPSTSP
jgi:cell division protein FtsL